MAVPWGSHRKPRLAALFLFFIKCRRIQSPVLTERRDAALRGCMQVCRVIDCNSTNEKEKVASQQTDPNKGIQSTDDLHILIVEDNLVNQRVLAKQMRHLGLQVAVANHGGEALEYLRGTSYCRPDESAKKLSLILMDWEIPVMNGLDCVRVSTVSLPSLVQEDYSTEALWGLRNIH